MWNINPDGSLFCTCDAEGCGATCQQDADGSWGTASTLGWRVATNKKHPSVAIDFCPKHVVGLRKHVEVQLP